VAHIDHSPAIAASAAVAGFFVFGPVQRRSQLRSQYWISSEFSSVVLPPNRSLGEEPARITGLLAADVY
jgi:hypothetical protein